MQDEASATDHTSLSINYPIHDGTLAFADYITQTKRIIKERRVDLTGYTKEFAQYIINTNSPFELKPPQQSGKIKCGALLIHGLFDCPFTLLDVGKALQSTGMLCRSILLPGHGTAPDDLISISYQDWLQALRYGVESMKRDVDHLFLIGYSTGAALSVYHALIDDQIAGVVLLAPAVGMHNSVDLAIAWHRMKNWIGINGSPWAFKYQEIDYAKYSSVTYNSVIQVSLLTNLIHKMSQTNTLDCPMFIIIGDRDETISSRKALKFFTRYQHDDSQMLLYSAHPKSYSDPRIVSRLSSYPQLNIKDFSHVSIPFAPNNPHYGQNGDYILASRTDHTHHFVYGGYTKFETILYDSMFHYHLINRPHRSLTYNPDFEFMANMIRDFVQRSCESSTQK